MKSTIIEEAWALPCIIFTLFGARNITERDIIKKNIIKDFSFFKPFSYHKCYSEWAVAVDLWSPWRILALSLLMGSEQHQRTDPVSWPPVVARRRSYPR